MNEALVVLMIVTANGIQTGPSFQTYDECTHISSQIQSQETFCMHQEAVDIDAAIDMMGNMLGKMKEKLNEVKNEDN